MGKARDLLAYDADPSGHRANYVRIFEQLTGGAGLVAPIARTLPRLLTVRHLVLPTLETAPKAFLAILLLRSLLLRRSAVLSLRAHLIAKRRGPRGLPGRLGLRLLERLGPILPLTLVPLAGSARRGGFIVVSDPESWDIEPAERNADETPLSARVRDFAARRRILLLPGNLDHSKGIAFVRDIFCGDPELLETMVPVLCGQVLAEAEAAADALRACGAFIEPRYLERAELMSLYRAADAAWCCYPEERDQSSGIFGRAVQFGIAPVLRRGSVLDDMAAAVPNAVRLDYGDVAGARNRLRGGLARVPSPAARMESERDALRSLLFAHFGIGPQAD